MKKSSLVVALVISVGLHIAVLAFGPGKKLAASEETAQETEPRKVAKLLPPPEPKPEAPAPKPPSEHKPEPQTPPPAPSQSVLAQPEEVITPAKPEMAQGAGASPETESDDLLPALRLIWDSPQQLIELAQTVGLRVLAVNRQDQPFGELVFGTRVWVKQFAGGLAGFSNRIRTIRPDFFGPQIQSQFKEPAACLWVLIPATIDAQWVVAQRKALRSSGLQAAGVSHMEAKIVASQSRCDLSVTRIVTLQ